MNILLALAREEKKSLKIDSGNGETGCHHSEGNEDFRWQGSTQGKTKVSSRKSANVKGAKEAMGQG